MLRSKSINPATVRVLVLDEADNMLEQGSMGDQSISIKKFVDLMFFPCIPISDEGRAANSQVARANKDVQIVLFSATFNDNVRNFASRFAPQANEIRLKQEELSLDAIKQFFMGEDLYRWCLI
jgi:ATP-dependent RNA helicase DDX19/DBP5